MRGAIWQNLSKSNKQESITLPTKSTFHIFPVDMLHLCAKGTNINVHFCAIYNRKGLKKQPRYS